MLTIEDGSLVAGADSWIDLAYADAHCVPRGLWPATPVDPATGLPDAATEARKEAALDAMNMPWESIFYEPEATEGFLSAGGYAEMPYFFTTWHEGANIYGTGPGDDALSDAPGFPETLDAPGDFGWNPPAHFDATPDTGEGCIWRERRWTESRRRT